MEIGVTDWYKHMHMEKDSSRQPEGMADWSRQRKRWAWFRKCASYSV